MSADLRVRLGEPHALGATWDGAGAHFALFKALAEKEPDDAIVLIVNAVHEDVGFRVPQGERATVVGTGENEAFTTQAVLLASAEVGLKACTPKLLRLARAEAEGG